MSLRLRVLLALLALAFFLGHFRALPRTLEDIDSVNFALGVEQFDVSRHRPHPPGYPVYIALAKVSTAIVHGTVPSWDRDRAAASGLAIWGLIAGTLSAFVLADFWLALGFTPSSAFFATAMAIVSPLFWFTAARPLSDLPGLVAAVAVQALLLRLPGTTPEDPAASVRRRWTFAAFAAGLLIGLRTQTMWLTGPLLIWRIAELLRRSQWRAVVRLTGAAALGALLWAVPLVWLNGGIARYMSLLGSQGSADFQGVEMLATIPTSHLLGTALTRTFVWPWVNRALADAVLLLAIIGLARLATRERRTLVLVLLSFVPYLLFHLAFQETETLRYALPMVVPVTGLAVAALSLLRTPFSAAVVGAMAAICLYITQPRLEAFARDGAPVLRGFEDMVRTLPSEPQPPFLSMQHQVWWGVQRVLEWYRPVWDMGPKGHPGDREWLALVERWTSGRTEPVWFLTDLTRNDVALFDPRSRTLKGHYEPASDVRALMPGPRLDSFNWWEIRQPFWMLGRGWSLTPEIAGMTATDHAGPHERAAIAFLRRGPTGVRLLIGGRYLGVAGSPPAVLSIALDGVPAAELKVTPNPIWFAHWIELPAGAGSGTGPYGQLTATVKSLDPGRRAPMIGLEQFDAATSDDVMFAFVDGWQEPEGDPKTGRLWRWTSDRSALEIRGPNADLVLTLSGESPLKSFDHAPEVVVKAGDRELGRFRPSADFSEQIDLPASAFSAAAGRLTIETNLTFVPAERGSSPDRRRLGLRVYQVAIRRK